MEVSTPAGINERWTKGWKPAVRNNDQWYASYLPRTVERIEYYIAHGEAKPAPELKPAANPIVDPPYRSWERAHIEGDLYIYAALHQWKWERAAILEGRFDDAAIATMFAAHDAASLLGMERQPLVRRRTRNPAWKSIFIANFHLTALAAVAFDARRALDLARLQQEELRRELYERNLFRPTSAFLARLFANYFGLEAPIITGDSGHLLKGEIATDPVFAALLAHWRDPDADSIAPHCLAALDAHTYLAYVGANSYRREFPGHYMRLPIAVLLVFRLRSLLGLDNPRLQHPLMDSAVSQLPREAQATPADPLLQTLRARMERDGWDPEATREDYRPR